MNVKIPRVNMDKYKTKLFDKILFFPLNKKTTVNVPPVNVTSAPVQAEISRKCNVHINAPIL